MRFRSFPRFFEDTALSQTPRPWHPILKLEISVSVRIHPRRLRRRCAPPRITKSRVGYSCEHDEIVLHDVGHVFNVLAPRAAQTQDRNFRSKTSFPASKRHWPCGLDGLQNAISFADHAMDEKELTCERNLHFTSTMISGRDFRKRSIPAGVMLLIPVRDSFFSDFAATSA